MKVIPERRRTHCTWWRLSQRGVVRIVPDEGYPREASYALYLMKVIPERRRTHCTWWRLSQRGVVRIVPDKGYLREASYALYLMKVISERRRYIWYLCFHFNIISSWKNCRRERKIKQKQKQRHAFRETIRNERQYHPLIFYWVNKNVFW
jgi:hypothetical protein